MKKVLITTILFSISIGFAFSQSKKTSTAKSNASSQTEKKKSTEPKAEALTAGMKAPELKVEEWLSEVPVMKGKFIALDFWGPSCKPCIAGFSHINELNRKFKDKVVFIASTTTEVPGDVYSFELGTPVEFYSMMQTPKAWTDDYKVSGIPHMVLVDPKGIVRYSGNGFELSESMLKEIVSKYDSNTNDKK